MNQSEKNSLRGQNLVINESDTFVIMSTDTLLLQVGEFSFYARAEADPLTPFLVRFNREDQGG